MTPSQPTFASSPPLVQKLTSLHPFRPVLGLSINSWTTSPRRPWTQLSQFSSNMRFVNILISTLLQTRGAVKGLSVVRNKCFVGVHRLRYHQGTPCSPSERLDRILDAADADYAHLLDDLYYSVLGQLFPTKSGQDNFRMMMGTVLSTKEPLTLGASLLLRFLVDRAIRTFIKPLGSLLHGVLDEE